MRRFVLLIPTCMLLLLLTACGNGSADKNQESENQEKQTSSVVQKSPKERLKAMFADARRNWKSWNQQDWIEFYKEDIRIVIDQLKSDVPVKELKEIEALKEKYWESWKDNDEDFDRMLCGDGNFKEIAEIWTDADPWGGKAFNEDKEGVALMEEREKAAEKYWKAHEDEQEDPVVTGTVEVLNEESEENDD